MGNGVLICRASENAHAHNGRRAPAHARDLVDGTLFFSEMKNTFENYHMLKSAKNNSLQKLIDSSINFSGDIILFTNPILKASCELII